MKVKQAHDPQAVSIARLANPPLIFQGRSPQPLRFRHVLSRMGCLPALEVAPHNPAAYLPPTFNCKYQSPTRMDCGS